MRQTWQGSGSAYGNVGESSYAPDELAPVDFFAVEFPGGRVTGSGFERLRSLADQGVIGILDLEFITKDSTGSAHKADIRELHGSDGVDVSQWADSSSGLLDDSDVDEVASAIQPGSAAAAIVYENKWVLRLVDAWRREGARLVADGGISPGDLVAALDATDGS